MRTRNQNPPAIVVVVVGLSLARHFRRSISSLFQSGSIDEDEDEDNDSDESLAPSLITVKGTAVVGAPSFSFVAIFMMSRSCFAKLSISDVFNHTANATITLSTDT